MTADLQWGSLVEMTVQVCLCLHLFCDEQKLYECEAGEGNCALTVKGNPKRESPIQKSKESKALQVLMKAESDDHSQNALKPTQKAQRNLEAEDNVWNVRKVFPETRQRERVKFMMTAWLA